MISSAMARIGDRSGFPVGYPSQGTSYNTSTWRPRDLRLGFRYKRLASSGLSILLFLHHSGIETSLTNSQTHKAHYLPTKITSKLLSLTKTKQWPSRSLQLSLFWSWPRPLLLSPAVSDPPVTRLPALATSMLDRPPTLLP